MPYSAYFCKPYYALVQDTIGIDVGIVCLFLIYMYCFLEVLVSLSHSNGFFRLSTKKKCHCSYKIEYFSFAND